MCVISRPFFRVHNLVRSDKGLIATSYTISEHANQRTCKLFIYLFMLLRGMIREKKFIAFVSRAFEDDGSFEGLFAIIVSR